MTVRTMLLSAVLALGLAAGCSKPPSPSAHPSSEPGAEAVPTEAKQPDTKQPDTAPAPSEPGTAPSAGGPEMKKGEPVVYIIKNSGVRCITTPCPYYNAFRADDPSADPIPVHELDLTAVTGGQQERQDSLVNQTTAKDGLRVEATLDKREHAGPAGTATVLRASKLVGG
ncbi:hypothetical protein DRW03_19935 [Corallococcus sp. H22C18031201]|uniref:DUF6748 domain-containing protein n=1 Tax=Citreicoccus inhibens TaxID=2849499 RepID=UPI000E74823B|nr:DUF6748 domain-containing protein [Citreicoccus inhibens]MBU8899994.1 hypothetical protein [Citreicoccus inhibens]RJS20042.1 hypothetical protein DRW03_19935 [Corallococcus sp. H22C18031201]